MLSMTYGRGTLGLTILVHDQSDHFNSTVTFSIFPVNLLARSL